MTNVTDVVSLSKPGSFTRLLQQQGDFSLSPSLSLFVFWHLADN